MQTLFFHLSSCLRFLQPTYLICLTLLLIFPQTTNAAIGSGGGGDGDYCAPTVTQMLCPAMAAYISSITGTTMQLIDNGVGYSSSGEPQAAQYFTDSGGVSGPVNSVDVANMTPDQIAFLDCAAFTDYVAFQAGVPEECIGWANGEGSGTGSVMGNWRGNNPDYTWSIGYDVGHNVTYDDAMAQIQPGDVLITGWYNDDGSWNPNAHASIVVGSTDDGWPIICESSTGANTAYDSEQCHGRALEGGGPCCHPMPNSYASSLTAVTRRDPECVGDYQGLGPLTNDCPESEKIAVEMPNYECGFECRKDVQGECIMPEHMNFPPGTNLTIDGRAPGDCFDPSLEPPNSCIEIGEKAGTDAHQNACTPYHTTSVYREEELDALDAQLFDFTNFRMGPGATPAGVISFDAGGRSITRPTDDEIDDRLSYACMENPVTDDRVTKEIFYDSNVDSFIEFYRNREQYPPDNPLINPAEFPASTASMCHEMQTIDGLVYQRIFNTENPWAPRENHRPEPYWNGPPGEGGHPKAQCITPDGRAHVPIHIMNDRNDEFFTCLFCEQACAVLEAQRAVEQAEQSLTLGEIIQSVFDAFVAAIRAIIEMIINEVNGNQVDGPYGEGELTEMGNRAETLWGCNSCPADCCPIIQDPVEPENLLMFRHEEPTWEDRLFENGAPEAPEELLFRPTYNAWQPYMVWHDRGMQSCLGHLDAIVGPGEANKNCGYGGWEALKHYQANCMKFFGLNCLCKFDETFKPGTAEEFAIKKSGAIITDVWFREGAGKEYTSEYESSWRNEGYNISKKAKKGSGSRTIHWPLAWRGYIDHHVPAIAEAGAGTHYAELRKRFPNLGLQFDGIDAESYLESQGAWLEGLDNARPGDIVIWNQDVLEDAKDMLPHVAVVTAVNLKYVGGGEVPDSEKSIWVEEYNYGKIPDICGTTSNWGMRTLRKLRKEFPSEESYAPPDDKPQDCRDPDRLHCREKYWNDVKIYRPSMDVRRDPDRYGCHEELDDLGVTDDFIVTFDGSNTERGYLAIEALMSNPDNGGDDYRRMMRNRIIGWIRSDMERGCDPPKDWMWADKEGEPTPLRQESQRLVIGDIKMRKVLVGRPAEQAGMSNTEEGDSCFSDDPIMVPAMDGPGYEDPEAPPPADDYLPPPSDYLPSYTGLDTIQDMIQDLIEKYLTPGSDDGFEYPSDIGGYGGPDMGGPGPGGSTTGSGPGGGLAGGLGSCTAATYAADAIDNPQAVLLAMKDMAMRGRQVIQAAALTTDEGYTENQISKFVLNYSALVMEGMQATSSALALYGYNFSLQEVYDRYQTLLDTLEAETTLTEIRIEAILFTRVVVEELNELIDGTVQFTDGSCYDVSDSYDPLTATELDSINAFYNDAVTLLEEVDTAIEALPEPATDEEAIPLAGQLEDTFTLVVQAYATTEDYIRSRDPANSCFAGVGGDDCPGDPLTPPNECVLGEINLGDTSVAPDLSGPSGDGANSVNCNNPADILWDNPDCFRSFGDMQCDYYGSLEPTGDSNDPLITYPTDDVTNYREEGYSQDYVLDYLMRYYSDWFEAGADDPVIYHPDTGEEMGRLEALTLYTPAEWKEYLEFIQNNQIPAGRDYPGADPSTYSSYIQPDTTIAVIVSDRYPRGHAALVTGYDAGADCLRLTSQNWLVGECTSSLDCQEFSEANCYQAYPYFGMPCSTAETQCIPTEEMYLLFNPSQ